MYIELLKPNKDTTKDEIKTNYKKLVKLNHPDLFPEDKRYAQNLILMEINELYFSLMSESKTKENIKNHSENNFNFTNNKSINVIKNLDYVYYKHAIKLYKNAHNIFNFNKYSLKSEKFDFSDEFGYKSALKALRTYIESQKYFMKVLAEFPDSIWSTDCKEKLKSLEVINSRYNLIINNF